MADPALPLLGDVGVDDAKASGVTPAGAVVAGDREAVVVVETADAANGVLVGLAFDWYHTAAVHIIQLSLSISENKQDSPWTEAK